MYTRCKACNTKFIPRFNKVTQQEEDLCSSCLTVVNMALLNADLDTEETPDLLLDLLDMTLSLEESDY